MNEIYKIAFKHFVDSGESQYVYAVKRGVKETFLSNLINGKNVRIDLVIKLFVANNLIEPFDFVQRLEQSIENSFGLTPCYIIAKDAGIAQSLLYSWIAEGKNPTSKSFVKYCDHAGITVYDFIKGDI